MYIFLSLIHDGGLHFDWSTTVNPNGVFCMWFCVSPDGGAVETTHMETTTQQTLHYSLANQQVQIHRIGEDGQVQVVSGPSSSSSSQSEPGRAWCHFATTHFFFQVCLASKNSIKYQNKY